MSKDPKIFHKGIVLKNISDGPNRSDTNPTNNVSGHTWVIDTPNGKTAVVSSACCIAICCGACGNLFTKASHGLLAGERVKITTSSVIPSFACTAVAVLDSYYVIASGLTACTFRVSATSGGCSVDVTAAGTGNQTFTVYEEVIHSYLCDGDEKIVTDSNRLTLSNKTHTSPVLNGTISGDAFLDEDCMCSDSAVKVASQQSIKAYVDSQVTAQDLDTAGDSGTGAIDLDSQSLTVAGGSGITTVAGSQTITANVNITGECALACPTSSDELIINDVTPCTGIRKATLANISKGVVHDSTCGFVSDEHVAHSCVCIVAGTGLTGGGDITASRTLNVIGGTGITANANCIAIDCTVATLTGCQSLTNKTITIDDCKLTIQCPACCAAKKFKFQASGLNAGTTTFTLPAATIACCVGSDTLAGLAACQTLTNKIYRANNGASCAPAFSFDCETDTGYYRKGACNTAFTINNIEAMEMVACATFGTNVNVGIAGAACGSFTVPLSVTRSQSASTLVKVRNLCTGAGANATLQFCSNSGAGSIGVWSSNQTASALGDKIVIRAVNTIQGVSLLSCLSGGDIGMYVGGQGVCNRQMKITSGGVQIGMGCHTIDGSAVFEVDSTTKGSVPAPSMSTAQRDCISCSATGLQVFNSCTKKLNIYDGAAWTEVGGGGAGGINHIDNPDAETNTCCWATYKDAAGVCPVNGTGGCATLTLTRITAACCIVRGTGSFKITKGAVNEQGEGVSTDFTIDNQDKGKQLHISFDYKMSSGYASSDMKVAIYDVTNAALIGVINDDCGFILDSAGNTKFQGVFCSATNSTSYRLIIHQSTSSAVAYNMFFDNVSVSPDVSVPGAIITEPVAYTPTFIGFGTATNVDFFSWREGSFLNFMGKFTAGTVTATEARITLGHNGSNNNVTICGTVLSSLRGIGSWYSGTTCATTSKALLAEASVGYMTFGYNLTCTPELNKLNGNSMIGSCAVVSVEGRVPISGWSSGASLSTQEAVNQTIQAIYYANACSANTSWVDNTAEIFDANVKVVDSHCAVTVGACWVFTAPRAGNYLVSGNLTWSNITNLTQAQFYVYKNGANYATVGANAAIGLNGTAMVNVAKGDTISVEAWQDDSASGARTINTGATHLNRISITSLPDFSTFSVLHSEKLPTVQRFTSGSCATYTTPAGVRYIEVEIAGGGGGGAGSSNTSDGGSGSNGCPSTFGSILTAAGGLFGASTCGGSGGAITVNSPAISVIAQNGAAGGNGTNNLAQGKGGEGGSNPLGGNGTSGSTYGGGNGKGAIANSGGGGGGAATNTPAGNAGGGGGAGGYAKVIVTCLSDTYTYTVGCGGCAGAAGTCGAPGGAGAIGTIVVTEYY